MSGGGSSSPQPQQVTQTTSNIPEYARPYFEDIMGRAQAASNQPYTPYSGQRIEDFNANQTQTQQGIMGLQTPGQFGQASQLAGAAGLGALSAGQYKPQQVTAQNYSAPTMQAAQTGYNQQATAAQTNYNPNLTNFQMGPAQTFGQDQAQRYMSPYLQNVLDTQKREAITDAQKAQLTQNLGAARQGTYGGSRQLLATTERERALGQQLGDIQGRGLQAAYENAQQQFERDRAAGYNVNQSNQNANLGVQQLGVNTGLQTSLANQNAQQQATLANQSTGLQAALANLNADQQSRVQNQAAQLQTQGLNAQQAMQAALANQQADQFGASYKLQGLAQANQSAQTLGNLGATQQQSDLSRLNAQQTVGGQQQALDQQHLDQQYADFLRQRDYPMEQLGYYSNILRGVPVGLNSTATTYAQQPSIGSQIAGAGLGAASLYNLAKG